MIFKLNVLSTHISAKQLHLQGSVKYSPKSPYIITPTLSRNGRIRRRVSWICGEWNFDWFNTGVRPHSSNTYSAITITSICITCKQLSLRSIRYVKIPASYKHWQMILSWGYLLNTRKWLPTALYGSSVWQSRPRMLPCRRHAVWIDC